MNKGLSSIALLVTLVIILALGSAYVYYSQDQEGMVCPQDARMCADGTYVGRTGPQCEFAPCPGQDGPTPARTEKNAVSANEQAPGPTAIISMVTLEKEGWVVVHDERNDKPGIIIAARRVNAGATENVAVDLLGTQTQAGKNYYVVLYNDDGDKKFDFKKDFPIKDASGAMIATKFMVEGYNTVGIAGWKTYYNDEYGFEFLYPEDFMKRNEKVGTEGRLAAFDSEERGVIALYLFPRPLNRSNLPGPIDAEVKNIKMGGKDGYQILTAEVTCAESKNLVAVSSEKSIGLDFVVCESHNNPFTQDWDQILSTFKFTK